MRRGIDMHGTQDSICMFLLCVFPGLVVDPRFSLKECRHRSGLGPSCTRTGAERLSDCARWMLPYQLSLLFRCHFPFFRLVHEGTFLVSSDKNFDSLSI